MFEVGPAGQRKKLFFKFSAGGKRQKSSRNQAQTDRMLMYYF